MRTGEIELGQLREQEHADLHAAKHTFLSAPL
jgi:hypothetical protein